MHLEYIVFLTSQLLIFSSSDIELMLKVSSLIPSFYIPDCPELLFLIVSPINLQ